MPLRLEIKKQLTARSDRVKSVDIHPSDHPWVLAALYNGFVYIWDYTTNTQVKNFELCEVPVRCAKFIARKQWFIAATDDMQLRVYNYNTMDKIKEWEAHTDYIRFVEVHPNRPFVLSSSDDMSIKLWDWERNFDCVQVFEGHVHYVMMVKINPRDTNTFASASLDRTIKVWGLTTNTPHFSLEGSGGHERGVNCIDYYPGGDKPYLISGADDRLIKIWDYQTKACLQTLEGHMHNVSAVCFHPRLPLILSASEDGTVRLWHSTTYRPESTLNYGLERAWCLAPTKDANKVAIGYDEGTVVLKLGNERPVASLDYNTGKIVWAQSHDIQTMSVRGVGEVADGEKVTLIGTRDLGACEVYPQDLQHNRNGQFICVCGDGEFIIYTSQALRNKAFGSALDFVWSSQGTGDYAVRESGSRIKTFQNFKEHKQIALNISSADKIFGGVCLAVVGPDCVVFYDWAEGIFIRKIDVVPRAVYWNDAGDAVVLACDDEFYVLRFASEAVEAARASGAASNLEDGIEGAFELDNTVADKVRTGQWVGDCFLFTNTSGKLNYYVGGEVMTLCHLPHAMYLLGYVAKEDRVFLIDKTYNVYSYRLLLSVLNYQTAVVRGDFEAANNLLPSIPKTEHHAIAKFLESQGFKEEALAVTSDADHKFELAIDLRNLGVAYSVLRELEKETRADFEGVEYQSKWRRLGDLALAQGRIDLAQMCAKKSGDLSGLLLLQSASGDKEGMKSLGALAAENGRSNVAFLAYFISGRVEECIDLLVETGRIPEAAFMARTYMPSKISSVLALWKNDLKAVDEKAADALADPAKYPNLFADLDVALKVEQMFLMGRDVHVPASSYPTAKNDLDLNLIEFVKNQLASQQQQPAAAVSEEQVASPKSPVRSAPEPEPEVEEEPEEEQDEAEIVHVEAAAPAEEEELEEEEVAAIEEEAEVAAEVEPAAEAPVDEIAALEEELNEMNLSTPASADEEVEVEVEAEEEAATSAPAAASNTDGDDDFLEEDW